MSDNDRWIGPVDRLLMNQSPSFALARASFAASTRPSRVTIVEWGPDLRKISGDARGVRVLGPGSAEAV